MDYVFISYSKRDLDFARHLRHLLEAAGFSVWMDEQQLAPSSQWWTAIERSIKTCAAFMIIMSPDSQESGWVQKEVHYAIYLHKRIFPIQLAGEIWPLLIDVQAENMTAGLAATLSPRLVEALAGCLPRSEPPVPAAAPENPPQSAPPIQTPPPTSEPAGGVAGRFARRRAEKEVQQVLDEGLSLHDDDINKLLEKMPDPGEIGLVGERAWGVTRPDDSGEIVIQPRQVTKWRSRGLLLIVLAISLGVVWFVLPDNLLGKGKNSTPGYWKYGGQRSTSNRAWTPITREFDGVAMLYVPAGCFEMGSSRNGYSNEGPIHEVCLDAFWLDKTEVTNAQFAAFDGQAERPSYATEDDHPRETITWTEAQTFCEKRGGRLPTEAEWEYAARGPESWEYLWGNDFGPVATPVYFNYDSETWDVSSTPRDDVSWVGVLGMISNVSEWVADLYGTYPTVKQTNPTGPIAGSTHVLRGDTTGFPPSPYTSFRDFASPTARESSLSFRCARSG